MIDERLKTREESGSTSSPTKRHPEHREGSIMHLSTLSLSKGLLLISFLFLAACTDYVQKMDDDFNEWEQAQQLAELSSSSQVVMSSSSIKSSKSSSSVFLSGDSREKSSNSTEQKSSSSSSVFVKSSSSVKESWAYLNPAISYGEIIDNRDGQVYKTVKIGEQTWMAENLNYETKNSVCYNDSAKYCAKYGRLYTWDTALNACPSKSHIPTQYDWNVLYNYVGYFGPVGTILKTLTGWNRNDNGTDLFGFSALPSGIGYKSNGYSNAESSAEFWSASEYRSESEPSDKYAYDTYLFVNFTDANTNNVRLKNHMLAVRCLIGDSSKKSSSSAATSSSSFKKGSFVDKRDNQTYKTVTIGSQIWMAENLNYETEKSFCYNDNESNCTKYGRVYTWAAAMDSAGAFTTSGKGCGNKKTCSSTYPVHGVCPIGWHLPSLGEWNILFTFFGGMHAGALLKSSGFSGEGLYTYFWSSIENSNDSAFGVHLSGESYISTGGYEKTSGYSVRCVKD